MPEVVPPRGHSQTTRRRTAQLRSGAVRADAPTGIHMSLLSARVRRAIATRTQAAKAS